MDSESVLPPPLESLDPKYEAFEFLLRKNSVYFIHDVLLVVDSEDEASANEVVAILCKDNDSGIASLLVSETDGCGTVMVPVTLIESSHKNDATCPTIATYYDGSDDLILKGEAVGELDDIFRKLYYDATRSSLPMLSPDRPRRDSLLSATIGSPESSPRVSASEASVCDEELEEGSPDSPCAVSAEGESGNPLDARAAEFKTGTDSEGAAPVSELTSLPLPISLRSLMNAAGVFEPPGASSFSIPKACYPGSPASPAGSAASSSARKVSKAVSFSTLPAATSDHDMSDAESLQAPVDLSAKPQRSALRFSPATSLCPSLSSSPAESPRPSAFRAAPPPRLFSSPRPSPDCDNTFPSSPRVIETGIMDLDPSISFQSAQSQASGYYDNEAGEPAGPAPLGRKAWSFGSDDAQDTSSPPNIVDEELAEDEYMAVDDDAADEAERGSQAEDAAVRNFALLDISKPRAGRVGVAVPAAPVNSGAPKFVSPAPSHGVSLDVDWMGEPPRMGSVPRSAVILPRASGPNRPREFFFGDLEGAAEPRSSKKSRTWSCLPSSMEGADVDGRPSRPEGPER